MEKEVEKEKNIILVKYHLKEHIWMEKGMEKEKNMKTVVIYHLKEHIWMEKGMEKEKNIILRRVIFDGEFSNGYIIEGIKYGRDGNLEFILERNGIGKEYYDGYLKFEGIYLRGEKNGKGKSYRDGKLELEGEFKDGVLDGKVKEYDKNGKLIFEGEYNNGKKW